MKEEVREASLNRRPSANNDFSTIFRESRVKASLEPGVSFNRYSLFDSYFFFFFFSKAIERADENEIRFSKQFSRVIARLKDWDFERDSSISGRDSEIGLTG